MAAWEGEIRGSQFVPKSFIVICLMSLPLIGFSASRANEAVEASRMHSSTATRT